MPMQFLFSTTATMFSSPECILCPARPGCGTLPESQKTANRILADVTQHGAMCPTHGDAVKRRYRCESPKVEDRCSIFLAR